MQDVLNFGRSGAGAPVKDSSGKVKAVVVGNPEIRFQENEGVQKSIQNAIRYHADPDLKSQYHADLGELIVKLTSELGLISLSQRSRSEPGRRRRGRRRRPR